jgi:hypothetical protein
MLLDGVIGKRDLVTVEQLGPDLRYGPVAREAAVPHVRKHVPSDAPKRHGDAELLLGRKRFVVKVARRIRTVNQLVYDAHGPIQCEDAVKSVVAYVHVSLAARTRPVFRHQHQISELRIFRPVMGHRGNPPVVTGIVISETEL